MVSHKKGKKSRITCKKVNNPTDHLFSMIAKIKRHFEWYVYDIFLFNFYQLRKENLNLVYFPNFALWQRHILVSIEEQGFSFFLKKNSHITQKQKSFKSILS